MRWLISIILSTLFASQCFAQPKVAVYVQSSAEDTVGREFVYAVKEKIRTSGGMELMLKEENRIHAKISIVTVDASVGSQTGLSTAISAVFLIDGVEIPLSGLYMNSIVQTCGRQRVSNCADSLVAQLDQTLTNLRDSRLGKGYWESLYGISGSTTSTSQTGGGDDSPPRPRTPQKRVSPPSPANPF